MDTTVEQDLHERLIAFAVSDSIVAGLYKGFSAEEGRSHIVYYFLTGNGGYDWHLGDRLTELHSKILRETDVRGVMYTPWPITLEQAKDYGFLETLLWKRD